MEHVQKIFFVSVSLIIVVFFTACLRTKTGPIPDPPVDPIRSGEDTAVFAGGCFWGVEGGFEKLKGVSNVVSGYTGGKIADPSYEQVSGGTMSTSETWHGYDIYPEDKTFSVPVTRSDREWKKILGENAWHILRRAGTERPYSGELVDEHRAGTYYSAATGQPLFRSEAKFDPGTGWPSFSKPIDKEAIILRRDSSFGSKRIEVLDSSSASHLGHVFDDGPGMSTQFPGGTGLRFCINSASMVFVPDGQEAPGLVKDYEKRHAEENTF